MALCFATLARNSPISLAIAVVAFPDRPLIALALVIGPLIELAVLAIIAQLLNAFLHTRSNEEAATSWNHFDWFFIDECWLRTGSTVRHDRTPDTFMTLAIEAGLPPACLVCPAALCTAIFIRHVWYREHPHDRRLARRTSSPARHHIN